MKLRQLNSYNLALSSDSSEVNTSEIALDHIKPQNQLPPIAPKEQGLYQEQRRLFRDNHKQLDHLYKQNYQPAKYSKAVEYRNARSYLKKLPSGQYRELQLLANTEELKYFGLGCYLYVQFLRRVIWLFLVMSLLVIFPIVICWQGSGMSSYASSFSTYLIKATIGNYSANMVTSIDGYIVTIIPFANYLGMFIFYLIWKIHFAKVAGEMEKDADDVKPEKFCLQIEGVDEGLVSQDQLAKFFSTFGPVYQVSLIRNYRNKLAYFQELDELEGVVKERQLEMILGGDNDKENLQKLKAKQSQLEHYLNTLQIVPITTGAYIHFEYEKSKADCLTLFNKSYLFANCSHGIARNCCCCCLPQPDERLVFRGQALRANAERVSAPQDINWSTFDISVGSRVLRGLLAFIIILVFLGVSCAIIGLCSIYIASHASNCENVTILADATAAAASTDTTAVQCFCDANLVSALSDSATKSVCSPYLTNIYVSQTIQYAVVITATLTNFLFGLIVDKLVNFVRPSSKSSGLLAKIIIFTVFLTINTIFIPFLIYADIFGFQPSNYISFITIISSGVKNFFKVQSITFYPNFTTVWYRNVSVIYINFLIINLITTWIFFLVAKCMAGKQSLQEKEGKILQKHMNSEITSYKLDVYKEAANFYMIMMLCCLFCSGVPALLPITFLNLLSRYIVNRSLLQSSSSRVDGLGEEFVSLTKHILPVILVFCPIVGEWMLVGNSDIYPSALKMTFPYLQGLVMELDRELYLPFYLMLSILAFCEYFFFNTLIRFGSFLCGLCYEHKEVIQPYHTRPFSEYAKGMNILYSYNIRNNDQKRNIVANMQKYVVEKGQQK